jgi:hypothetical protein
VHAYKWNLFDFRAISVTLQMIKADEGNVEAYAIRGMNLSRTPEQNSTAVYFLACENCIVLTRSFPGIALSFSGETEQACKHLREALRLDPDHRDASRCEDLHCSV